MSDETRAIVDYAEEGNAKEMRDALYAAIQSKVMDHIEAHKMQIAKNLIQPQLASAEDEAITHS